MKKKIFFLFAIIVFSYVIYAQELKETMYVANKQGLSVYEKPFYDAKIIGKLTYGQKITVFEWSEEYHRVMKDTITEEGLDSRWQSIKYNNKKGYILNTYLLPVAPPKKGTTTIDQYFKQISPVAGTATVKEYLYGSGKENKTLFKNGIEAHTSEIKEVYALPNFTVQQAFLLLRLLKYKSMVKENDSLPILTAEKDDEFIFENDEYTSQRKLGVERDYRITNITISIIQRYYINIYESRETNQVILSWYEEQPGC